jgi:hypothetical protein
MRTLNALTLCAAFALLSASCSSVAPTRSGFLADYAELAPRGDEQLESAAPASEWTSERYHLAPIEWRADDAGLSAERKEVIRRAFERDLARGLDVALQRAEPGARDALQVRAAITQFEASAPWGNALSFAALGLALDNGGAAVEFEVLAPDGRALLRSSASRSGSVFAFWRGFSSTAFGRAALRELASELGASVARSSGDAAQPQEPRQ